MALLSTIYEVTIVKLSVVTVTYNSGEKLKKTIDSIISQSFTDFEIIVKDGLSTDGSLKLISNDSRLHVYSCRDTGIYDAMNQAVEHVSGEYVLFLNCGDVLHDIYVLEKVNAFITSDSPQKELYYGDVFVSTRNGVIPAADQLDDYTLITRTICHQCLFFSKSIFTKRKYDYHRFGLAADMGLYVACLKADGMKAAHMPFIVSNYEGGGVSETAETKRQNIKAKQKIMKAFYTKKECQKVVVKKIIHLRYLKEWLSCSEVFLGMYEWVAGVFDRKMTIGYQQR